MPIELPGLPRLPPLPGFGGRGMDARSALGGFPQFLQQAPGRIAQHMFGGQPGAAAGNAGNGATAGGHAAGGNAAQMPQGTQGGAATQGNGWTPPVPSGLPAPPALPLPPGIGRNPAPTAPQLPAAPGTAGHTPQTSQASAPVQLPSIPRGLPAPALPGSVPASTTTPGTQPGLANNLLSLPGRVIGGLADGVRTALGTNPVATTTPGAPAQATPGSTVVAPLVNTVRALFTPPQATPTTQTVQTLQTAQPPAAPVARDAGAPATTTAQLPAGMSAQSAQGMPVATTAQQPGAGTVPATPQQHTAPMPATAAQAQRADAVPAPAGNPAADRAGIPMQAPAPAQVAVPAAPQGATLLAAVPVAAAIAQAQTGQQVAGNTQIAGNTQASAPVAGEKGGPSRAELPMVGVYTADGPGLRRRERMKVGAQQLGEWLVAFAQGRPHLVRPHDDTPNEITRAFQWLFWTLAIVAYGCLGLVLVSFLLSFGDIPAAPAMRRWTGEFALAGLVAAVGAWWLGRRILGPGAAPDPRARGTGRPPAA